MFLSQQMLKWSDGWREGTDISRWGSLGLQRFQRLSGRTRTRLDRLIHPTACQRYCGILAGYRGSPAKLHELSASGLSEGSRGMTCADKKRAREHAISLQTAQKDGVRFMIS